MLHEPVRHSWTPRPLNGAAADELRPSVAGLLYAVLRHIVSGETESLKTWLAMVLMAIEIQAGNAVLWVDFELGRRQMRDRLHALGLDPDTLDLFFRYVEPTEPLAGDVLADVDRLLQTDQPTLVVVDAAIGALALHGCDPNSGADVERFYRAFVDPLRAHGAAVLILDHLTKAKEGRGKYAIGSERKVAACDVHLGVEVVRPFSRGSDGLARIIVHKDRPGHLPRPRAAELHLHSDADTGAVTYELRPAEHEHDAPSTFRPTVLMDRVLEYLSRQPDPVSRSEITRNVSGQKQFVLQAIDCLVAEQRVTETAGARGAKLISPVHPFPTRSDPFPGTGAPTTRSPVPPSTEGDRNGNGSPADELDEFDRLLAEHADIAGGNP